MSVLPLLLKFAKPKCGGSEFPKPDSVQLGGVEGVRPHIPCPGSVLILGPSFLGQFPLLSCCDATFPAQCCHPAPLFLF